VPTSLWYLFAAASVDLRVACVYVHVAKGRLHMRTVKDRMYLSDVQQGRIPILL
jgi:hypothetical protein